MYIYVREHAPYKRETSKRNEGGKIPTVPSISLSKGGRAFRAQAKSYQTTQ
jgi:hypothetical protein